MPSTVMLLRHAEKPLPGGPPHGVTVDGAQDPESLTPRGWQRAGAIAGLFVPDREGHGPALPTPTHLFASQIGPHSSSRRPRETLLPLSERLGLTIDTRFLKEELGELTRAIRAIEGVVLVAWEHHLIPSIANMLVADHSTVPQIWPDDRFDLVWVIDTPDEAGAVRFREVPQLLLAGDQPTPIGSAGAA